MVRKGVRVVVPDQSAIVDLLGVIFPIVHVARAVGEDDTINTQRCTNGDHPPKRGDWLKKGSRRCGHSCCGRFVVLAVHNY